MLWSKLLLWLLNAVSQKGAPSPGRVRWRSVLGGGVWRGRSGAAGSAGGRLCFGGSGFLGPCRAGKQGHCRNEIALSSRPAQCASQGEEGRGAMRDLLAGSPSVPFIRRHPMRGGSLCALGLAVGQQNPLPVCLWGGKPDWKAISSLDHLCKPHLGCLPGDRPAGSLESEPPAP